MPKILKGEGGIDIGEVPKEDVINGILVHLNKGQQEYLEPFLLADIQKGQRYYKLPVLKDEKILGIYKKLPTP